MLEIDADNARPYLESAGLVDRDEPIEVCPLSGGVSNMVLLVERPSRPTQRFVLKQARHQLRTREPWFARLERIWREVAVLEVCDRLLASATPGRCGACRETNLPKIDTPRILAVDRDNYLFAMSAAPAEHVVWKAELLAGRADQRVASACAHLLGTLHALSWRDPQLARELGDRSLFDELRIDPYYRTLASVHPELRPELDGLIASIDSHLLALVLADFSPKNLLVSAAGLLVIDFETGHFGDPAFDLGFFQSHLVLKAVYHAPRAEAFLSLSENFWRDYRAHLEPHVAADEIRRLEGRMIGHFAGCALARIDGKSPVDYLGDPGRREAVRRLASDMLRHPPDSWQAALNPCRAAIGRLGGE